MQGGIALAALTGSWGWHTFIFVAIVAILLIPGGIELWRWRKERLWCSAGFVVVLIVSALVVWGGIGLSAFIGAASWVIEHRILVLTLVVGVVAIFTLAWFLVAERRNWHEAEGGFVDVAAVALGAVGAVVVSVVLVAGLAWNRRYEVPLGVDTTVPHLNNSITGNYVAFGDSYSAGEGLNPFLSGSGNGRFDDRCHRSPDGYPELLSSKAGLPAPVFRACSGARSRQVFTYPQNKVLGIQATPGILNHSVGLVTLTMGGNDVHFSDLLQFCAKLSHCLSRTFDPGKPAIDENDTAAAQPLSAWADAMLPIVSARLEAVFSTIRRDVGPAARVVVVGYPRLLPSGRVPRQFDGCDAILSAIDPGERKGLGDLEARFNRMIFTTALRSNVEYVDPAQFFDDHEACGEKGALLNDTKVAIKSWRPAIDPGAFHPRLQGQLVLARELVCYLNANSVPPRLTSDQDPPGSEQNPIPCP